MLYSAVGCISTDGIQRQANDDSNKPVGDSLLHVRTGWRGSEDMSGIDYLVHIFKEIARCLTEEVTYGHRQRAVPSQSPHLTPEFGVGESPRPLGRGYHSVISH